MIDPGAWLDALAALWGRERETTRARFAEERRGRSLAERVARGQAARDLAVDETGASPGGRVLVWLAARRPRELEALRAGPGDPVRLWRTDPDEDDAVRATLARRRDDRLAVVIDGDVAERVDEGVLMLDREAPEETFDRGDRAIARLRAAPAGSDAARLGEALLGVRAPRFGAEAPLAPFDAGLNGPQRAAVARALAAADLALIHGPPGTGKTRTLVEVVRQEAARGSRVLCTAASNTAVDNLAERLADAGVDVVRLGHPARVAPSMEARTLDALLEETEEWALARRWLAEARALRRRADARSGRGTADRAALRELRGEARGLERDARRHLAGAQAAILGRARVVCATAAGADGAVLGDARFDLVVLDEATQCPDPIALCALGRAGRAVLAGDPHQLPPTVIDLEAARAGLATTFFERLGGASLLVVQHRMNDALMAFPSRSKYRGRLVAAPDVAGQRLEELPGVAADPLRPGPLVFVDSAGKGWVERRAGDDPSTSNPTQAARVAAEVRRLLGRGLPAVDAAVITPYDAQARQLRELLAPEVDAGLEVGTVDGFQGREKEAIVVDLVRSNEDGAIGFLADTRRMNVALTRARRFLLVVGDSATLGGHPYYVEFLESAQAAGAWISAWADEPG